MKKRSLKLVALGVLVTAGSLFFGSTNASAAVVLPPASLSFASQCSDWQSSSAIWEVTNSTTSPVSVSWQNSATGQSGTFTASTGGSAAVLNYLGSDDDNRILFTWLGGSAQANTTKKSCTYTVPTPPNTACFDGDSPFAYIVSGHGTNTLHVTTVGNVPLCEDAVFNYTSYLVPDSWDGNGFNQTAVPQTMYSTQSVVLPKDTEINVDIVINMPPACNNYQLDYYFGDSITGIDENGQALPLGRQGTGHVWGQLYAKTISTCNPGQGGGDPDPDPTPETPTTPPVVTDPAAPVTQVAAAVTPAATTTKVLADTGTTTIVPSLIAIVLTVSASLVAGLGSRLTRVLGRA